MHFIHKLGAQQLSDYKVKFLQCKGTIGKANACLSFHELLTLACLLRIYASEQYFSLCLYHIYANHGNMNPSCSVGGKRALTP